jgi:hypothetical protein
MHQGNQIFLKITFGHVPEFVLYCRAVQKSRTQEATRGGNMKRRILMLVVPVVMLVATFSAGSTPLDLAEPGIGNVGPLPMPCAVGPICDPR